MEVVTAVELVSTDTILKFYNWYPRMYWTPNVGEYHRLFWRQKKKRTKKTNYIKFSRFLCSRKLNQKITIIIKYKSVTQEQHFQHVRDGFQWRTHVVGTRSKNISSVLFGRRESQLKFKINFDVVSLFQVTVGGG